ncbi:sensor histidine kinase [Paenibacillus sp. alder61]|uniref:sensor histidine kinase n=1 Tax=Paenibacillus sp. alder61 TaxID=2862948 RepID=UPI001CD33667|nr:sensor histidine kinase [Paenibacillus sp. alder61]MCA1296526.1 sensor histidine kinase [Paenibacillus sp. alder61]
MKAFFKAVAIIFVLVVVAFCAFLLEVPDSKHGSDRAIKEWEVTWADRFDPNMSVEDLERLPGWTRVEKGELTPEKPDGTMAMWARFNIPEYDSGTPALLFQKIYGSHVVVIAQDGMIYESKRKYKYETNTILLPLDRSVEGDSVYVGINSGSRIGLQGEVLVGDFREMQNSYIKNNMTDFIIGCALIFIAVVMLICSLFLKNGFISSWFSLCLVILSSGILVITYSSFLYSLYGKYGDVYVILFDLSLVVLLPAFTSFFESIFGRGYKSIITKFKRFQMGYSLFCILFMIFNFLSRNQFYDYYKLASMNVLGIIMIVQFVLLISLSTFYMIRGNQEATIFSIGFFIFAVLGLIEISWFFFKSTYYDLYLWKWGVVCFVITLIIVLGKRFTRNHEQVVEYSKQLELFNNELQRSEKMEIISELAASVAHEVRNPLQVTRGFLQLLMAKQNSSDKVYLSMALEELDRASNIITDFLTFAKPEVGKVTELNVLNEFIHIEGILVPMANLQGGKISVHIPQDLYIKGNSSKFKQAFINIIKNSIESLNGEGEIQIWAYEKDGEVSIHIKDTGEGMDEEVLSRLGEPYFSNKTKGTGLGLMVTFRIIEIMNGKISFTSEKGVGTEAVIRFPALKNA